MRFGTDVISGVPSIVMGIFAYTLIVLPQRHFSALCGRRRAGFHHAADHHPHDRRDAQAGARLAARGSLALGAPEWRTSLRVLLPAAVNGVLTGVMLAVARAAGEAAPMLFTAFGNPFMSTALDQPIATLPHTIFVYAISPYADWRPRPGRRRLVLIVLVLGLNILARA